MLVLTLAGFALRLPLLDRFPFREDEAIYSYWALHGWHTDPLFLNVWPDKPPVFIWTLSLAFQALGATPAAARALNVLFSTLTIPVVAVTARRWWGDVAGVAAASLLAFNPFAISFAPTVFTDSLLVLAGSLALCLAARRRFFWAGVWLGVAIMTKQQGLLFVPLVVGTMLIPARQQAPAANSQFTIHNSQFTIRRSLLFTLGLALIILPIFYWDSLRWAVAPSPWDLGARNVGAVTFADPMLLGRRWQAWLEQAWYLLASWPAWAAAVLVVVLGLIRTREPNRSGTRMNTDEHGLVFPYVSSRVDRYLVVFLAAWGVGVFALHVVTSVQVWDRYLLPLVIPLVLIVAWAIGRVQGGWRKGQERMVSFGLLIGVILLCVPPALQAADGRLPIGGDHGAYAGLDAALAWVEQAAPTNAVLYHRELGWHERFYLYDAVRRGDVDLRWYPNAAYLADNATKAPHKRKLLIVPDWSPVRDLSLHLSARRLALIEQARVGHFTVYEIVQPPAPDNSWRACRPSMPFTALTAPDGNVMMCRE